MNIKDRAKDSIVDFINDEAFYAYKKNKAEIEKGTLAIHLFATVSLLSYIIFFLINNESFEWLDLVINMLVVIIYYCLAVFSNHEPFNAFICTICIVAVVLLANLFLSSQPGIKGLILKVALIVYISMKLEAAKMVQAYNKTNSIKA